MFKQNKNKQSMSIYFLQIVHKYRIVMSQDIKSFNYQLSLVSFLSHTFIYYLYIFQFYILNNDMGTEALRLRP